VAQIDALQTRIPKIGVAEISVPKDRATKPSFLEGSAPKVNTAEICILQDSPAQVGAIPIFGPCRDVRPSKIGKGAIAD
jgi:hypothetical protein